MKQGDPIFGVHDAKVDEAKHPDHDKETKAPPMVEYNDDTRPCLVARLPCGHYCSVHALNVDDLAESIPAFIVSAFHRKATIEIRPVSFVRDGGLTFGCACAAQPKV
jgi:hypothetical protein